MTQRTILTFGLVLGLLASAGAQTSFKLAAGAREQLTAHAPRLLQQLTRLSKPAPDRKTVADRNGNGQLDSVVLYNNYSAADSFPQSKAEFKYPDANTIVETDYENLGGWQVQYRSTQHNDNLGRALTALAESFDPNTGQWVPDSRLRSFPHGNSMTQVDSFTVETWDAASGTWNTALQNATSFDNQDRPVVIFTYISDLLGFELTLLDELAYDANGDNHLTEQSIEDSGSWLKFSLIERTFVQHRETVSTTYYIVDDSTLFQQSQTLTDYDNKGNPVLIHTFEADPVGGGWVLADATDNGYDSANRLIWTEYQEFGNDAPPMSRTDYQYQTGTDLHVEISSAWDNDNLVWVPVEKSYYYYGSTTAGHEPAAVEAIRPYPNPTTGVVSLPVADNARVLVLNAQGQSVPAGRTNSGLDLSALPAGSYYITVDQDGQRRTGSVVKQ